MALGPRSLRLDGTERALLHIDRHALQPQPTVCDPRHVEQIVDQTRHVPRLALEHGVRAPRTFVFDRQQRHGALNRRHGIPELVSESGQKVLAMTVVLDELVGLRGELLAAALQIGRPPPQRLIDVGELLLVHPHGNQTRRLMTEQVRQLLVALRKCMWLLEVHRQHADDFTLQPEQGRRLRGAVSGFRGCGPVVDVARIRIDIANLAGLSRPQRSPARSVISVGH